MIRMIDNINNQIIPINIEAPRPINTETTEALEFAHRGNLNATDWKAKPQPKPKSLPLIDGKVEAHPEALTKLQYADALGIQSPEYTEIPPTMQERNDNPHPIFASRASIHYPNPAQINLFDNLAEPIQPAKRTNPNMNASSSVRQCYMTIKLHENGTIDIRSKLDNRFPLFDLSLPFKLKSGQIIDKGKVFTIDSEKIECLAVDNQHHKINDRREVFFWYYELSDNPIRPLADYFTEQEELMDESEREKHDPFREWQLADIFLMDDELDISQQDEHAKTLTINEAWDYCQDSHEPIGGKILEKHINTGLSNDQDDKNIADIRYFMTQLRLPQEAATRVRNWTRTVIGYDQDLTNEWILRFKGELKDDTAQSPREACELIKHLADELDKMEADYQDDNPPTADYEEVEDAITELSNLDNDSINSLLNTADQAGIDRDELKGIIVEAKIANDPTRSHEAHARQFTPTTPNRLIERPHNINLTMKPDTDDLPETYEAVKTLDPRTDNLSNWINDIMQYAFIASTENKGLIDDDSLAANGDDYGYHPVSQNNWTTDRENKTFVISHKMNEKKEHILISGDEADQIITQQAEKVEKGRAKAPASHTTDNGIAQLIKESAAVANKTQPAITAGCDFL